jgi:hypothetical protein
MKYVFITVLITSNAIVWAQNALPELPMPKRFINKIEVFAGPSLSFNYGNKFIENYKDEFVMNKRKIKPSYVLGVGVYHPMNDCLDINFRLMYEEKGTNSQMETPGLLRKTDYTYRYVTISLAPRISLFNNTKLKVSAGGFFSKIRNVEGRAYALDTQNNVTFVSNFNGREIRELRPDGSTGSITFAPGLKSFQDFDFGITLSLSYSITINSSNELTIQLQDNLGLQNINKQLDVIVNPPEKNHTISILIGYSLNRIVKL